MSKIQPAGQADRTAIAEAVSALRYARTLLRTAGAERACKVAARAIDSAVGAFRHVSHCEDGTMSRYELRALAEAIVVTRGVIGWDRPLQTFFAQLFSIDDEGEEHAHVWIGTYPCELDSAAAALAVVASHCIVPDDLAKTLETDRLATLGTMETPIQTEMKSLLAKPAGTKRD